ncbi:MAG: hypothetical protein JWO67_7395 [Streptosporangiaceae bacterium]|nr:hypothetical protein [Streptosporangiaceae bacterium]
MTDTDGEELPPVPPSLAEVSLPEMIQRARSLPDLDSLIRDRGELMVGMRALGLSWRQIEQETGIPIGSAHRWAKRYTESQQ